MKKGLLVLFVMTMVSSAFADVRVVVRERATGVNPVLAKFKAKKLRDAHIADLAAKCEQAQGKVAIEDEFTSSMRVTRRLFRAASGATFICKM